MACELIDWELTTWELLGIAWELFVRGTEALAAWTVLSAWELPAWVQLLTFVGEQH